MAKEAPTSCAGLVTFSSTVSLIGDATAADRPDPATAVAVYGPRLSNEESMRKAGRASGPLLSRPVSEARPKLTECLFGLRPFGGTALGPAVVAALAMLKVGVEGLVSESATILSVYERAGGGGYTG